MASLFAHGTFHPQLTIHSPAEEGKLGEEEEATDGPIMLLYSVYCSRALNLEGKIQVFIFKDPCIFILQKKIIFALEFRTRHLRSMM